MDTPASTPNKKLVIIGMLLAMAFLALWAVATKVFVLHWFPHLPLSTTLLVSRLLFWLCFSLIWLYVIRVEKQAFFLWKEQTYPFMVSFASVCLIMVSVMVGGAVIALVLKSLKLTQQSNIIKSILQLGAPLKLFTVFTAAVTEELIFRAYLMPRLQLFFKSHWWPIIISTLIFGLGHVTYGTLGNVLGPLMIGAIFAWYYYKYRNIKVLIICHFIIDFIALFLVKQ